ncbi:iron response transcriptional regulator IrrA [Dongia sp.]|uniref:iron response transcriptional regulator IrrA n=1 Tax=Dongia sp. TaxID=1977262 RepID=UPI0035AE2881
MTSSRNFTNMIDRLRSAGLRPTAPRLTIAKFLFEEGDRHVTAEELQFLSASRRHSIALATIYNTLKQFKDAGLLREVMVGPGRSYFDTNVTPHHHFFLENEGRLIDIPESAATVHVSEVPPGTALDRIDVVVRIRTIK